MRDTARAQTLHAEGVRATAQMRPAEGERLLRAALRTLPAVSTAPTRVVRGRILLSLAHARTEQGQVGAGLRLLAQAEALLPPDERGVLYGQRALMLLRTGRYDLALPQFDAAVAALDRPDAAQDLARALLNRAVLHLGAARVRPARADLARCADIAAANALAALAAKANHNLAYVDFLAGDLPRALRRYRLVGAAYAELMPSALPVLAVDRARALLAAGLYGEADAELADATDQFGRQRLSQDHAEAMLARAEVALLGGRPAAARRWADLARRRFVRRDNARWAALADLCRLRADLETTPGRAGVATRLAAVAARLDELGLADDARLADVVGIRALVRAGRIPAAARRLAAGPPPRRLRLDARLQWRLARAEVAAAAGRRAEADRHLRAGLDELQRHRGRLGSLDLQTSAAVHGRELAALGLRAALAGGRPDEVYRWSERARAQALRLTSVLPPDDPEAAAALEELRQVHLGLREAEMVGRPAGALRARRAALRRRLRERDWGTAGSGRPSRLASLAAVRGELGSAAMVAFLRDGAALHAWVATAGRTRLVRLGEADRAEEALRRLLADLDAQAGRALPRRLAEAVAAATRRDLDDVQAALLDPVLALVGDRDLVVIPTGALVSVPWAMLPAGAGRPVTVTPSATTWLAARQRLRRPRPATTLLAAGPGNDRGEAEIRAIAALRPGSTVLAGPDATPEATLRALPTAALAHVAAHGRHETDNPLFSTLELWGGPVMGYDLQRLTGAPAVVVLSSCDLGLTQVRPGDETLGMAAVLLSVGTGAVVASVSRVADHTAMEVMTRYHAAAADRPPAVALAGAGAPGEINSFICIGAG
jgi:hypothetical protein